MFRENVSFAIENVDYTYIAKSRLPATAEAGLRSYYNIMVSAIPGMIIISEGQMIECFLEKYICAWNYSIQV